MTRHHLSFLSWQGLRVCTMRVELGHGGSTLTLDATTSEIDLGRQTICAAHPGVPVTDIDHNGLKANSVSRRQVSVRMEAMAVSGLVSGGVVDLRGAPCLWLKPSN